MSYAVGGKQKKRQTSLNNDDEENTNPLLSGDLQKQKKAIDIQLSNLKTTMKQLEDYPPKIGTEVDNHSFR